MALDNEVKCLCLCVRMLTDYIFYLSTTKIKTRKTLVRVTVVGLLRNRLVVPF